MPDLPFVNRKERLYSMKLRKRLVWLAGAMFAALCVYAAVNVLVDPFGAFGDPLLDWYAYDITRAPGIAKPAYLARHHAEYDAYVLGATAAEAYDPTVLEQYTDCRFYNLFLPGALPETLTQEARYLLEHYEVRRLIVDLTPDGKPAPLLHASLTGESEALFSLRLAFGDIHASAEKLAAHRADTELPQDFDAFDAQSGCCDDRVRDVERIGDLACYLAAHGGEFEDVLPAAPDPAAYAAAVQEIEALCEAHSAELTVVFSPVYGAQTESDALRLCREVVAAVTDFWDFSASSVSCDPRYFYDAVRPRAATGALCLAHIFGDEDAYVPENLGVYVTGGAAPAAEAVVCDPAAYSVDVPILMYHHLAAEVSGDTVVTPETFRAQMELLRAAGAQTVTLEELYRYVFYGEALPDKPVLVTFDDGYRSNYELALPILEELGMQAVTFPIGVSIGHETYKDTDFAMTPHYGYDEIRAMLASGVMDVQSHTYDMHQWEPFETESPARSTVLPFDGESEADYCAALRADLETYRREFEEETGRSFLALAYPSGQYNALTEVVVHAAGIPITLSVLSEGVNTVMHGVPQTLYALSRMGVSEATDASTLLSYVLGGA